MRVAASPSRLMPGVPFIPSFERAAGCGREGAWKRRSVLSDAADQSNLERARSGATGGAPQLHVMADDEDPSE